MTGWETLYCAVHPDRIALERCEVCQKPLCAYCLYYTEDGQRLCHEHADEARRRGMRVEEPGVYAAQLIGAQIGADRKEKRGLSSEDGELYKGNSNDMLGFIGMLVGLLTLTMCCGGGYCLPFGGFAVSLIALLNAKKSYDPRRTRRYGIIGVLLSSVWIVLIAACILFYGLSLTTMFNNISNPNFFQSTIVWQVGSTNTPPPSPAPPTRTPTADDANTTISTQNLAVP